MLNLMFLIGTECFLYYLMKDSSKYSLHSRYVLSFFRQGDQASEEATQQAHLG